MTPEKLHYDPTIYGESNLVRCAIRRFGAEDREFDVRTEVQNSDTDAARDKRLTFNAFHNVFPDIPMRFAAPAATGYFTASPKQVADLLAKPNQARLAALHATTRDELWLPPDQPLGLLFRYGGTQGGHILHDGGMARFGGGTPIPAGEQTLVFSRFYTVLDAIAAGEMQSLSTPATAKVKCFHPGLPIPRWIRRTLGCKVDAQVVALVDQLCTRRLPRAIDHWSHWIDGERWARCKQDVMARCIGCKPSAVKRAIAALLERGMLERKRTVEGNAYRLGPALCGGDAKETQR